MKSRILAVALAMGGIFVLAGCRQTHSTGGWERPDAVGSDLPAKSPKSQEKARVAVDAPLEGSRDAVDEVKFLRQQVEVLQKEKEERIREIQRLRSGVRTFTESVRDSFEKYRPEIKDYFGGELYDRDNLETAAGVILIDRRNRPQAGSIITGARAFVRGSGRYVFCLLRVIPNNENRAMVVAMSQNLETKGAGLQEWTFFEPITVQNGDYIGLYSYGPANVPYDDKGTGDVVLAPTEKPRVKYSTYSVESHAGRDSRAYSFGAVGYMRLFEE